LHHDRDGRKEFEEVGKHAQEEYDKRMHITRPQTPASPKQSTHRRASIKMAPSNEDEYHRSADAAGVASFEVRAQQTTRNEFLWLNYFCITVQKK